MRVVLTSGIIQTSDGYLWVGSWAGVVRFDGVRFTPVAGNLPNVDASVRDDRPATEIAPDLRATLQNSMGRGTRQAGHMGAPNASAQTPR